MSKPKLSIIVASTRPGRVGLPIAQWVAKRATSDSEFAVQMLDLKAINLPFLDEPNHPRLKQYTHQHTKDWSAKIEASDAFIFVMPEYNYGFNAPLKNAIDYLNQEWKYKPVGLVSYGGVSAGTRAAQMIKQVVTTLDMMPLNEAVSIPFVAQFMHDGQFQPNANTEQALTTMLHELYRWTEALWPLRAPEGSQPKQLAGAGSR